MANTAGNVGMGNDGQTDKDRGSVMIFPYTKNKRPTGKVGSGSMKPNSNTSDGNKEMSSDPRKV